MTEYAAFLRGINVGGNAKVPMARLSEIAGALGWENVRTYLNSGNLTFSVPDDAAGAGGDRLASLAAGLSAAVAAEFDLTIPVVVRERGSLRGLVEAAEAAFPNADAKFLQIGLMDRDPGAEAYARLGEFPPDLHTHLGDILALHYVGGQGTSKLTTVAMEKALGTTVTVRGVKTLLRMAD